MFDDEDKPEQSASDAPGVVVPAESGGTPPPAAIPDAEAGPFFTRVLDRIRAGAAPAVALRDERVASSSSWVADVILFE